MKEKIRALYEDTLFKNSFYLMINTGVQAALGFIFWIICAHLFSPAEIGIGTALISAMGLISYASALGFNNTFTRFLPNSTNRDNEINTGVLLVISAAIIVAFAYVIFIPYTTPALAIIHKNIWYAIGFVVMVALAAINLLTDSIFIAYRGAKFNLFIDGIIMGLTKVFLPFVFIGLGAYGVFVAAGSAASVAMVASILSLIFYFNYKPRLHIDLSVLKNVFHYSFANYIGDLLNIAPTLVLPLIIIDRLGSANAGYYYLALSVANLLNAVGISVATSLFAEGSYGEVALHKLVKRSAIMIAAIMVPAGLVLAFLGPFVLEIFGKSYSQGGAHVIIVLALAAPAVAAYTVGSVILRIKNQLYSIIAVNVVYFLGVSGLAFFWAGYGITWVAGAWLAGNIIAAGMSFLLIYVGNGDYFARKTA
jgi:O-antigen/teichoic acid export membrane protein